MIKTLNKLTTYQIILQSELFFFDILEFIETQEELKGRKIIPILKYNEILDNFLLRNPKNDNTKIALSIDNLLYNEIINEGDRINDLEVIVLTQHIIDLFKNLYKEFAKPLTETEYNEFFILIKEKRIYFEDIQEIKHSKKLEEMITATENLLEKTDEYLSLSVNTLRYKKEHLGHFDNDIINNKKEKLKISKELNNKYISPLYYFTNDKTSLFMQELKKIREILQETNKLSKLKRKIDFYYKQYLIHAKNVQPIRRYISNYIEQEEKEITRILGTEYLFNHIRELFEEFNIGKNKKYLWTIEEKEKIEKLNVFFDNISTNSKDNNIKTHDITQETINKFQIFIEEESGNIQLKRKKEFYINEITEELKMQKIAKEERKKDIFLMKNLIKKYEEKILQGNIIENIILLLNENFYDKWNYGDLEYLTFDIIKKNKPNTFLKNNHIYQISQKNNLINIQEIEKEKISLNFDKKDKIYE